MIALELLYIFVIIIKCEMIVQRMSDDRVFVDCDRSVQSRLYKYPLDHDRGWYGILFTMVLRDGVVYGRYRRYQEVPVSACNKRMYEIFFHDHFVYEYNLSRIIPSTLMIYGRFPHKFGAMIASQRSAENITFCNKRTQVIIVSTTTRKKKKSKDTYLVLYVIISVLVEVATPAIAVFVWPTGNIMYRKRMCCRMETVLWFIMLQ